MNFVNKLGLAILFLMSKKFVRNRDGELVAFVSLEKSEATGCFVDVVTYVDENYTFHKIPKYKFIEDFSRIRWL